MPTVQNIKDWAALVFAIITCIAGIIFWVQSAGDEKIESIEKDITELKSDIKIIQNDNREIIRIMGRLEGLIDK